MLIPSQRHLFDIPEDVAYLNCAFTAPLLKSAAEAAAGAVKMKSNPWTLTPPHFFSLAETVREGFARLVSCNPNDVAIIPAVSYGIAVAARNIPVKANQAIVLLQDQFPSNVYVWRRVAEERGAVIRTVPRPEESRWTPAVLDAIGEDTAVVALGNCHWTDGTFIDLVEIGKRCRQVGAALVVDGTQSLGAMPFSVPEVQPDFLVTTAHKWMLGPYSFGYCYVAPKWQNGTALEENWLNRADSENFAGLVDYKDDYQPGARRFDVGEVSNFFLSPVAARTLQQIHEWGVENIARTLKAKTSAIAARARELRLLCAPEDARSPHMIGISVPGGFGKDLPRQLAEKKVYVSVRGTAIRISPHLYTVDADIDRLFEVLGAAIR